jgi:hypothetical protein
MLNPDFSLDTTCCQHCAQDSTTTYRAQSATNVIQQHHVVHIYQGPSAYHKRRDGSNQRQVELVGLQQLRMQADRLGTRSAGSTRQSSDFYMGHRPDKRKRQPPVRTWVPSIDCGRCSTTVKELPTQRCRLATDALPYLIHLQHRRLGVQLQLLHLQAIHLVPCRWPGAAQLRHSRSPALAALLTAGLRRAAVTRLGLQQTRMKRRERVDTWMSSVRGSWPLTTLRMGRLSSCSYASIMNAMPGMPCSVGQSPVGMS